MVNLKNMSKKKKVEYIWEYYKLYIIGVLVITFMVGSLIYSQVTKVDCIFNLTIIGNMVDGNKRADLEKQLTSLVVKEGDKKKQALVEFIPQDSSSKTGSVMSNQNMQKFIASLSVGEIDVVILDKHILQSLAKQDAFSQLDNIAQLDLDSVKNEKVKASGSDNNRVTYAIDAGNIKTLKDMGFDTTNKVISIATSSKQKDKAALVIKWMLNRQ